MGGSCEGGAEKFYQEGSTWGLKMFQGCFVCKSRFPKIVVPPNHPF